MTVPLFPVSRHYAGVREAQFIFFLALLLSFIARLWMCLLSSSPRGRQAGFVFFSDGAVCFQKFLGGEFLSCAGLLESKHIGPFLLIPAFPSPPHQLEVVSQIAL